MKKIILYLTAVAIVSAFISLGVSSHGIPLKAFNISSVTKAGIANPLWISSYQVFNLETASAVRQTGDGSYIVGGYTYDLTRMHDILLFKVSPYGRILWQRSIGGADYEEAADVQQTADGGYIVAGHKGNPTLQNLNFWILKFDGGGNVLWQKLIGTSGSDAALTIHQMTDGGYLIGGYADTKESNQKEALAVKLYPDGSLEWNQAFGGSLLEEAHGIRQTTDKGYVFCGMTSSEGRGGTDLMVVKLDINREIEWQIGYGGSGNETAVSIEETLDRGYIVAGKTESFGAGGADCWVLKLNYNGIAEWQFAYGGPHDDSAASVQQTEDGTYIVAGTVQKNSGGSKYVWLLKLDEDGSIEWQKIYGKNDDDAASCIRQTREGGFITAGSTNSYAWAGTEIFLMKTDAGGGVDATCDLTETFIPQVTETEALWYELDFIPRELSLSSSNTNNPVHIPGISHKVICWNYIQPPVNINLSREVNRFLGFEEAANTLSWQPSPDNTGFTISKYNIYRRNIISGSKEFELIATVSADIFSYSDSGLVPDQIFQYAVTSADDMNLESPLSPPVTQNPQ